MLRNWYRSKASQEKIIGFFDSKNKLRLEGELVKEEEVPDVTLNQEYLDNLYSDLNFKTYAQIGAESQKIIKGIKTGYFLIFLWLVVIPTAVSILEFYSDLLSVVVLIYSAYKDIQTWLEPRGKWPKSKRDKEEERLKNHYYYHCRMNPEGFQRLKQENFEKMVREQIAQEAGSLRKSESQTRK